MDITATYSLTERDLRTALRNLPAVRRMFALSLVAVVAGVLTSLLEGKPMVWMLLPGPALLVMLEVMVVRGGARKNVPLFSDPWVVRMTEESYSLRTAATEASVEWRFYREVTERAGFWYAHQVNREVSFMPQRALDEEQRAELADFFARTLPPVKRPWYRPF